MKVYIETLGCPKNFNDSEVAGGILETKGYLLVSEPENADVIIVNTCGFISDAKKESIDRIFQMAQYKSEGKRLVVTGCLSQRYGQELFDEMPEVDGFLGVNDYDKLPEILSEIQQEDNRVMYCNGCDETSLPFLRRRLEQSQYSATLKIAEGCDNKCSYCSIPEIRGYYRSKTMEDVIEEAEFLAENGCKELIIIAQDVTYYGVDLYKKRALPQLLRKLCKIDGIQWIRLMYCYDNGITDELIDTIAIEDKVCKYIDIPIQHASDKVLKSMNRHSTVKHIEDTLNKLRKRIPEIHVRTTLMTGFPGEREEDYDQLIDFVERIRFDRLGVFSYSQEENTIAGEMEDQIPDDVKEMRKDGIMRRQLEISCELNREKVGKIFTVLVEERDTDGSYVGRTAFDAPEIDDSVIFTSDRKLNAGDMVSVIIEDSYDYDLVGREICG